MRIIQRKRLKQWLLSFRNNTFFILKDEMIASDNSTLAIPIVYSILADDYEDEFIEEAASTTAFAIE